MWLKKFASILLCSIYLLDQMQWTSKYRTIWLSNGNFPDTFWVRFFEWSGIWMTGCTKCPLFEWLASLDRFMNNKILFDTFLLIKWLANHLKTGQKCPVFIMIIPIPDHSNMGPFKNQTCLVFRYSLYTPLCCRPYDFSVIQCLRINLFQNYGKMLINSTKMEIFQVCCTV
jgi:hypothetical protein